MYICIMNIGGMDYGSGLTTPLVPGDTSADMNNKGMYICMYVCMHAWQECMYAYIYFN